MWRARNNEIFNGEAWPSFLVAHLARLMADESKRCLSQSSSSFIRPPTGAWEPPSVGFWKVNVDGSVLWDSNQAAFGVIIRNDRGEWGAACSGASSTYRVLHVELLAIKHGLIFAWDCGLRSVICETDCLEAFDWIQLSTIPSQHLEANLLFEIRELVIRPWCVRFSLVLRDANRCVDHLARRGALQYVDFQVWCEPWHQIATLMAHNISPAV